MYRIIIKKVLITLIFLCRILQFIMAFGIALLLIFFLIVGYCSIADEKGVLEFLKFLCLGSASTFVLYGLKAFIFEDIEKILIYLSLRKDSLSDNFLPDESQINPLKTLLKWMVVIIKKNVSWNIPIRAMVYTVIISTTIYVGYDIHDRDNLENKEKHPSVYYENYVNRSQSNEPSRKDFKLTINFEHEDDEVKKFGEDELETLSKMLLAFNGCLLNEKEYALIEIKGFASEIKWDDFKEEIKLANRRATNIEFQINHIIDSLKLSYSQQIKVLPNLWEETIVGYNRMIKERVFYEANTKSKVWKDNQERQNYTSEYLNRRAEIIIKKIGVCY